MKISLEDVIQISVVTFSAGLLVPIDKYYIVLGIVVPAVIIMMVRVSMAYNPLSYQKLFLALGCFMGGHLFMCNVILGYEPSEIDRALYFFAGLALPFIYIGLIILLTIWKEKYEAVQNNKLPIQKWASLNLFQERIDDLERLKEYILQTNGANIVGIDGKWGDGKTFLTKGLIEVFDNDKNKYAYLIIDVLSVRLEQFPQYMVGQLDNLLYKNKIVSKNSKRLRDVFNKPELNFLSELWSEKALSYTELFNSFRDELLDMNKDIFIIFEDLDRINNVEGIKNIFYLAEKLTEGNENRTRTSVRIIYQYNSSHMNEIGISSEYLEKYIPFQMPLTQIGFVEMVNRFQKNTDSNSIEFITDDELYRLPPHFILPNSSIIEERDWARYCFTDKITIRRVKQFQKEFEIKINEYPPDLDQDERNIVVAMCFIKCFMSDVYRSLQSGYLYGRFICFDNNGQAHPLREICSARDEYIRYLDPHQHKENFELYIAWRLLSLDVNAPSLAEEG